MLIALVPVVIALIGILLYFIPTNAKLQEVGRILFFIGMFWLVSQLAGKTWRIGPG